MIKPICVDLLSSTCLCLTTYLVNVVLETTPPLQIAIFTFLVQHSVSVCYKTKCFSSQHHYLKNVTWTLYCISNYSLGERYRLLFSCKNWKMLQYPIPSYIFQRSALSGLAPQCRACPWPSNLVSASEGADNSRRTRSKPIRLREVVFYTRISHLILILHPTYLLTWWIHNVETRNWLSARVLSLMVGSVMGSFDVLLLLSWKSCWRNGWVVCHLRCHDLTIMAEPFFS